MVKGPLLDGSPRSPCQDATGQVPRLSRCAQTHPRAGCCAKRAARGTGCERGPDPTEHGTSTLRGTRAGPRGRVLLCGRGPAAASRGHSQHGRSPSLLPVSPWGLTRGPAPRPGCRLSGLGNGVWQAGGAEGSEQGDHCGCVRGGKDPAAQPGVGCSCALILPPQPPESWGPQVCVTVPGWRRFSKR